MFFGLHEDDPDPAEWIQRTNEDCNMWSHAECLEMCEDAYVCVTVFLKHCVYEHVLVTAIAVAI